MVTITFQNNINTSYLKESFRFFTPIARGTSSPWLLISYLIPSSLRPFFCCVTLFFFPATLSFSRGRVVGQPEGVRTMGRGGVCTAGREGAFLPLQYFNTLTPSLQHLPFKLKTKFTRIQIRSSEVPEAPN